MYGYGKDNFYSISEEELPRAIRAQVNGTVAILNEGTVAGNNIMAIMPDYNRHLGYKRDYVLTGEDYDQIGDKVQGEYIGLIQDTRNEIAGRPTQHLQIRAEAKTLAKKLSTRTR